MRANYRNLLVFILLGLLIDLGAESAVYSQNSIFSGMVKSAKTNEILPDVNVFLSRTTIGTYTDKTGKFLLQDIPPGTYTIVFSRTGFKTLTKQLTFPHSNGEKLNVFLKPSILHLDKIIVTGSNKKWKLELKKFKKYFLGSTKNAKKTVILNPQVLRFKSINGNFVATAVKPLKIKNRGLGYSITFYLHKLTFDGRTVITRGYPKYLLMTPKGKKQKKYWEKRRKQTYHGSFSDFIHALVTGSLKEKGFSIWFTNKRKSHYHSNHFFNVKYPNRLYLYINLTQIRFAFYKNYKYLQVVYTKRNLSQKASSDSVADFVKSYSRRHWKVIGNTHHFIYDVHPVSWIALPEGKAILDTRTGNALAPYSVELTGYWGLTRRIPNLLPRNYNPKR
jgi:hypothetical protein